MPARPRDVLPSVLTAPFIVGNRRLMRGALAAVNSGASAKKSDRRVCPRLSVWCSGSRSSGVTQTTTPSGTAVPPVRGRRPVREPSRCSPKDPGRTDVATIVEAGTDPVIVWLRPLRDSTASSGLDSF